MENKLNLITYRQAGMGSGSNQSWFDSIVIFNDKRFRVKAEFVKKTNDDGNLNLNKTIYRQSNFIIVNDQIYHRNDYIDTGILEIQPPENGLIVYFLIPFTRQDLIVIVENDNCALEYSHLFNFDENKHFVTISGVQGMLDVEVRSFDEFNVLLENKIVMYEEGNIVWWEQESGEHYYQITIKDDVCVISNMRIDAL